MRDQVVPVNNPFHPPIVNRKGCKFYWKLVRNTLKEKKPYEWSQLVVSFQARIIIRQNLAKITGEHVLLLDSVCAFYDWGCIGAD